MKKFEVEGLALTDTDIEDVNNYTMLKREDSVLALFESLSVDKPRTVSFTPLEMIFYQHLEISGICVQFLDDARHHDLVCLLQKWCLEGPYPIDQSARFCFQRGRNITIGNTVAVNDQLWRQLALIMKECLKQTEDSVSLVKMSPMMRYYGDLYPDNGRDENLEYKSMDEMKDNMGIDSGIC